MPITKLGVLNVCSELSNVNHVYMTLLGFPGATVVKKLPANAGDTRDAGWIPLSGKIPWRRKWQHTLVFQPGKFHGQRNLVGYSPWGYEESDATEQLSTLTLGIIN